MGYVLKANGHPVTIGYIKSAIDTLGLQKWLELNPWAEEYAQVTDTKTAEPLVEAIAEDYGYLHDLAERGRHRFRFKREKRGPWY